MNVATVVDIESTFAVLHRCPGCTEGNPVLRPAINRGRFVTYAVQFGWNAVVAELARRAENDPNPNSFWHYLPYSLMASHSLAGVLNLNLLAGIGPPLRPLNAGLVTTPAPFVIPGWAPPHSEIMAGISPARP